MPPERRASIRSPGHFFQQSLRLRGLSNTESLLCGTAITEPRNWSRVLGAKPGSGALVRERHVILTLPVPLEGFEPPTNRLRAGCASIAPQRHFGRPPGNRTPPAEIWSLRCLPRARPKQCLRVDSNHRHPPFQGSALPTELPRQNEETCSSSVHHPYYSTVRELARLGIRDSNPELLGPEPSVLPLN